MEGFATYLTIKRLLQNRLLVISYAQLVKLLKKLEREGLITTKDYKELLKQAEHLKRYDLPVAE